MDESKSERGKVLGEPKWVLEGSEKGCFSLWKITGNEFDRGWTVSAGIRDQPDVSQPYVVEFRCGKVENLGGRKARMKKRGSNMCGGSYMTSVTS